MAKTRFDTKGIKTALSKLQFSQANFYKSISEFIWNGFDAKASIVELSYEIYQNKKEGRFRKLEIKDNFTFSNFASMICLRVVQIDLLYYGNVRYKSEVKNCQM